MHRRLRTTAGLLALLSLTLSVAESVWASTCAPGMPMESPAAVVPSSDDHAPGCLHVGTAHDDMDEGRHASDDGRPCPFGSPAAAQACTGVASLPARPMNLFASWSQGAPGVFSLETQNELLLDGAQFHPPRA